ncbi:MAG TPA: deoxyribonuclease V [Abditibacteriaceae bacterium]|jgi:deoxyribonuclease V
MNTNWQNLSPREAIALQKELREQVVLQPLDATPQTIAGADISFNRFSDVVYAGIVVMKFPTLEIIEEAGVESRATFPYVPGLLSFRELPALIEAWQKLASKPDVLVLDGQGIAHPRRFGIACHAGLTFDVPTLGCAKSVLSGKFDLPDETRGNWSPMMDKGETIGAALRTKNRVAPVYVSPGHKMNLKTAIELMLACDRGYRVPETTRQAHLFVNRLRVAAKDTTAKDAAI